MAPDPEFILGTVQLGLPYGRTNSHGQPTEAESLEILGKAMKLGITTLDTARAYGDSEHRIGHFIHETSQVHKIISKLIPLTAGQATSSEAIIKTWQQSLDESLKQLQVEKLHVLMAHRVNDLFHADHSGLHFLRDLKARGVIDHIGVSLLNPCELEAIIPFPEITHIQIPVNILDHRWSNFLASDSPLARRTYHARSCFLQGLLLEDNPECWPTLSDLDIRDLLNQLDQWVIAFNRESRKDLCLAYVRTLNWVDGIVLGIATADQLLENHALLTKPLLTAEQVNEIRKTFPALPEQLLNPSAWD